MPDHNTWWNARVGWKTPDPLDEDAIDLVMHHLQPHHGVLGQHPIDGVWEVTISLQAPDVDTAVKQALDVVAGATGETPITVEVLREDVFTERLPHIPSWVKPRA